MIKTLVLDACALIAFLNDELGADIIEDLLEKARQEIHELVMNKINLLEIYYGVYRDDGHEEADSIMEIIGNLPVHIVSSLTDEVFMEAGHLKAKYRISLADSIALAEAIVRNTELVTADHHEFDQLVIVNEIKIYWVR
jgi:predicted nucleic acid-binding protein